MDVGNLKELNNFIIDTKDQWARDDPAFLVLLSAWLLSKYS